jgi:hypothetical protein
MKKIDVSENLSHFTLNVGNRVSLRLYGDTRPHCLEIAPLQKGLVLVLDGRELIEEGAGFGLPVVKYEDKTYFSGTAETCFQDDADPPLLTKTFCLDTISRKRLGKTSYVNDNLYSLIHGIFNKAYLARQELAPALNAIMELRKSLKIDTDFVRVPPRGKVKVTYACFPDLLEVRVDFPELRKDRCQEILVLNEQGATFFSKYFDTNGLLLSDRSIGAWQNVKAEKASLSDRKETLSFTLKNKKSAKSFRGWERTKGRFSWAGLGYSLPKSVLSFNYGIQLKIKA